MIARARHESAKTHLNKESIKEPIFHKSAKTLAIENVANFRIYTSRKIFALSKNYCKENSLVCNRPYSRFASRQFKHLMVSILTGH